MHMYTHVYIIIYRARERKRDREREREMSMLHHTTVSQMEFGRSKSASPRRGGLEITHMCTKCTVHVYVYIHIYIYIYIYMIHYATIR